MIRRAAPAQRTLVVAAGVHTLDPRTVPGARALVLDGEQIAWVGQDPADAPPHDWALDLGTAWVTPAFVDAHVHATATGLAAAGVDLGGCGTLAECLDRLARHAAERTAGVIDAVGWDDFSWPQDSAPRADDLARVAPGRTVLAVRVDAHSCVVDSATLAALPLDRLGGVDRGCDGTPTGLLREQASEAAMAHVRRCRSAAELAGARDTACRLAAALGISALHEMGHPGLSGLDDALAWAVGAWPVDVLVWWADLDADAAIAAGLRPGGDLFLDGSIGSHTAAVEPSYLDTGGIGELFHRDDDVSAFFAACTAAGRGGGVHAIGERAIAQAARALAAVGDREGDQAVRACRHRVEHLELPSDDDLATLGRLGVVASVQPGFDAAWGGQEQLYARRLGPARASAANPLADIAAHGLPLAFGSDSTVTPLDPWGAIHAAEHHLGGRGLTRAAALAAHTLGGRFVAGEDAHVGALRAGMRADLAVWDADPLAVDDVRDVACLATLVRGRAAHGEVAGARR
ncbi:amidohydrolase [soil metagenome]